MNSAKRTFQYGVFFVKDLSRSDAKHPWIKNTPYCIIAKRNYVQESDAAP